MAIHEELNPDIATLPFVTARAMRSLATDNSARTAGVIVVPNLDGTNTVLGTNGLAPWVGDTTPPGRPLDIEATSHLGTALIRWGGELEGGIPSDFRCVQVWARQAGATEAEKTLVGVLSSAGEVNTGVFDAGATLDVWATALDNAHDRDGSPAYNESVESEHVQVEILPIVSQQEFDEAADNILAAADESVKAQIERVDTDLAATNETIDRKAGETLAAANAAAEANLNRVQEEIAGEGGRIDQAANSAYERAKEHADALKAQVDAEFVAADKKISDTANSAYERAKDYTDGIKAQVDSDLVATGEAIDAAADKALADAKADTAQHIEQVNKDLEATSDRIDTKADEILEAAKADATAKADAVDQKVQATNSKVQANAAAISAAQAAAEDALQNAAELLVNGGFEQGPVGWRATDGKAFVQDSQWCRSGVKRAYLNGSAGTKEIVSVNPVAVSVGRTYRFAAWYKLLTALSGNDSGGLRLMGTTDATVSDSTVWTPLPPTVDMQYTGDTWTRAVQTVVVPDGVKWIRAAIVFTSPVDAYFDDCSLIDATDVVALETAAANAQATADEAKQAALGAQVTADGKNAIYRQTTDPALDTVTAGKLVAGDLWWQTSEANLETYWLGEPNNSVSVLVDHSDEIEAMWIWNGSRWNRHVLYAQDLLVNGSIVAELLAVDCVEARHIKVGAIEADKLAATALYGHVIKGGTFLTSNERLIINNEGLLLKDSGGNATITMLASNGSATFRDVNIIDGSLTTPWLVSSYIAGGTVSGATVTGGTIQTVNDAHKGIKLTGGNLDIYRSDQKRFLRANESGLYINDGSKDVMAFFNDAGTWKLKLTGPVTSGGEISGATVTGGTVQTSAEANKGIKLADSNLDAYTAAGSRFLRLNEAGMWFKDGDANALSFAKDSTGRMVLTIRDAIQTDGEITGATVTGCVVQTVAADKRGIKLKDNNLDVFSAAGKLVMQANEAGISFKDAAGADKATFSPDANGVWNLRLTGMVSTGGAINGGTVTGTTVQTNAASNRGVKLYSGETTTGNLDIYRADGQLFLRANEDGLSVKDGDTNLLSFAKVNNAWKLSLKGAIQSGGEISGAAITGPVIRTNTEWQSSDAAKKYRGVVITDGGMFAYKNNGKEEYSMAFTAATGELKLDGAISTNAVFNAPTISAGQMVGTNIYTSTDADNRVSITSAGLTVTHDGNTVISFAADGAVDLGTSGIAADSRVSGLESEVRDSYTPLDVFDQTTGVLADSVADVQEQAAATSDRLDEEIDTRKQYMRFDPDTGLTIGDLTNTDAYSVQLTSTAMQFRAGNTVAAYVSNDRLYINNAEVVNTLRIGNFAFLPRDNGHMSLQYVGGDITPQQEA